MPSVIEKGNQPLWRQIQKQIKQAVLDKTYIPGEKLPTEHAWAKEFGVNRHTIRRAVAGLVESGILKVEQGRGMFVAENVLFYPIGKRTRFSETVEKQNRSRGRKVLSVESIKADAKNANALMMLRGRTVLHLLSVSEVDNRPVNLSSDYFNKSAFPDLAEHALETKSITESLKRCGVTDYFRKSTKVTTRMPSAYEAEMLKQPQNQPVIVTESVDIDNKGHPIGLGVSVWSGERIQLIFES